MLSVFWYRSPKYMVHLSIHSGLASSSSISVARLSDDVSATKASTRSAVGMRPVRSRVTRRMNSQSVVGGAGTMPCFSKSAKMYESMESAAKCSRMRCGFRLRPPGNGRQHCRHLLGRCGQAMAASRRNGPFGYESLPLGAEIATVRMFHGQLLILCPGDARPDKNRAETPTRTEIPVCLCMNSSEAVNAYFMTS